MKDTLGRLGSQCTILFLGAATALACKAKKEDTFTPWVAACSTSDESPGSWQILELPDYVTGIADLAPEHVLSDGDELIVHRDAFLASLGPGSNEWNRVYSDRAPILTGYAVAASPDYVLVYGGFLVQGSDGFESSLELLDRITGVWATVAVPEAVYVSNTPVGAFWDETRFLFPFLGRDRDANEGFLTATAFNPATLQWEELPRLNTGRWRQSDEPINGNIATAYSASFGLMMWGIFADESDVVGGIFADGEWKKVTRVGAPSPRRAHDIVAADDGFYVVGGIHVDSGGDWEHYGEVWHYDPDADHWSLIKIPKFVDPRKGAWFDGKLYVFGACAADAAYDPSTESWELLPPLEIPDYGVPVVAGGRIFITEVTAGAGEDLPQIFAYDPAGLIGAGGAGAD